MSKDIDRQIAEKVMGWNYEQGSPYRGERAMWCTPMTDEKRCGLGQKFVDGWKPSTNIAHAFEVVERMKDKWTFAICNNNVKHDYCAEFWNDLHPMDKGEFMQFADTPAMAICLAALEAVKGGNDGNF